ncbi:uncharacterized protein A4U43_C01F23700 [Asparagus officinalis]|uniref:PRA1 family protein n=1 Tax=Asparagus officinalis TaxID=4686 RepID=A0A5P1FU54_ASPOF|nr:uncharacterized protein A4U43_C01F23700 [Asparagus officinalis]
MAAWLLPLLPAGRAACDRLAVIGDKAVLVELSVVTLVLLLLTKATLNILVSLAVGVLVVVVHAAGEEDGRFVPMDCVFWRVLILMRGVLLDGGSWVGLFSDVGLN